MDKPLRSSGRSWEIREGNDTGGEIRKSIDELSSLQNRISRLHEECFLLSQAISDWQKDQNMLSDMADANSH